MPAITLDRIAGTAATDTSRPVRSVTTGPRGYEGEGFPVVRAFAGVSAGSGILHIDTQPAELVESGGTFHGIQLWVNLPRKDKFATPRYQAIEGGQVKLLSSDDGGALVRIIAGEIDDQQGPGSTHTPITLAHATIAPGARVDVPWNRSRSWAPATGSPSRPVERRTHAPPPCRFCCWAAGPFASRVPLRPLRDELEVRSHPGDGGLQRRHVRHDPAGRVDAAHRGALAALQRDWARRFRVEQLQFAEVRRHRDQR